MDISSRMETVMRLDLGEEEQFHVKRSMGIATWVTLYVEVRGDHFELFGHPIHARHEGIRRITSCTFPCDFAMPSDVEQAVRKCMQAIQDAEKGQRIVNEQLNRQLNPPPEVTGTGT